MAVFWSCCMLLLMHVDPSRWFRLVWLVAYWSCLSVNAEYPG